MNPLRALAATTLLAAGPAIAAGQSPTVFHDPSAPPVQPLSTTGSWGVAPDGANVVVHLECPPFGRVGGGDQADATLRLAPQGVTGAVSAAVLVADDSTDLEHSQDEASVTAAVGGVGVAYFQLEVSIDEQNRAAGSYGTTVAATLTAP